VFGLKILCLLYLCKVLWATSISHSESGLSLESSEFKGREQITSITKSVLYCPNGICRIEQISIMGKLQEVLLLYMNFEYSVN
jgi:hypothetical protein